MTDSPWTHAGTDRLRRRDLAATSFYQRLLAHDDLLATAALLGAERLTNALAQRDDGFHRYLPESD